MSAPTTVDAFGRAVKVGDLVMLIRERVVWPRTETPDEIYETAGVVAQIIGGYNARMLIRWGTHEYWANPNIVELGQGRRLL